MVDHLILSTGEEVKLDTTNNTITIVLVDDGNIEIKNESEITFANLQNKFEMFTLSISTGVYTAKNLSAQDCNILIVREFIY
jgi:5-deoxy-D-glucuronate isomerase